MESDHHVYVLECADGSLYTGYTTDLERRVAEHDAGEGAKYTRGRTPVELVHAGVVFRHPAPEVGGVAGVQRPVRTLQDVDVVVTTHLTRRAPCGWNTVPRPHGRYSCARSLETSAIPAFAEQFGHA